MKSGVLVHVGVLLVALSSTAVVRAQAIATLDENSNLIHVLANNTPGAVTVLPESLLFDVNSGAIPGLGLIGVTVSPLPARIEFTPNDNWPSDSLPSDSLCSDYRWLMRLRVLEGNDVSFLATHAINRANVPGPIEYWEYQFDISSLTPADGWVTLRQDFSAPGFTFGNGDGMEAIAFVVIDQFKTRLHVELDYLQVVPVPEPGSAALLLIGIGGWAIASVRREQDTAR
jgi:hypothetical protein